MNAYLENLCISVASGLVASSGAIQTAPAGQARDWVLIGTVFIGAAALSFINGMRQLHKEVP